MPFSSLTSHFLPAAVRTAGCLALLLIASAGHSSAADGIRFEDVTRAAGLEQPLLGMMGHGGAWGDFDNDGLVDLYVGGFADRPNSEYEPADGPGPNRLLRNLGNGRFERVDQKAVEFYGRTSGAVFADLDNNGTLELYVANNARRRGAKGKDLRSVARLQMSTLFRNDNGKLVDISEKSGAVAEDLESARNIGVFDYDGDGLLDLLVIEDKFTKNPRSILFRNEGNLKFKDVNKEAGIPDDVFGLGLAVADINEDGRPDFFVGHSNRMFLSGPDNRYHEPESLKKLFAWQPLDGEDWPCGAAFGDLNRDGRLDLVLGIHFEKARNRIYLNTGLKDGVPQFRDVTEKAGLPQAMTNKSPHVEIQDFDNDGWPDLYFSTATLTGDGDITPLIYRNLGTKKAGGVPEFEVLSGSPTGNRAKGEVVYFPAGPSADYDRDGRIDLCLINWFRGNHTRLLRNESTIEGSRTGNWLDVRVVGRSFNRMGIGTQVRVYRAGQAGDDKVLLGLQELTIGYGYASGQPAVCHFGLGEEGKVDIEVRFPDGQTMSQKNVEANQQLVLEER